jgi:hypothetical protein
VIAVLLTDHEARALARSAEFMRETLDDIRIESSFPPGQSALELAQAKLAYALDRELTA